MDTPIYVQTQSDLDRRLAAAAFTDLRTERRHGAEHLHVAAVTDRSRVWRELAWIAGVAVVLALVVVWVVFA